MVSVLAGAVAQADPVATYQGGATITAHVSGELPGYQCQLAGHDISGPWRPVGTDGAVDLESGPLAAGRHTVTVLCENRRRGDATTHVVGRNAEVFTE